jgi:hypothetical protein
VNLVRDLGLLIRLSLVFALTLLLARLVLQLLLLLLLLLLRRLLLLLARVGVLAVPQDLCGSASPPPSVTSLHCTTPAEGCPYSRLKLDNIWSSERLAWSSFSRASR